MGRIKQTVLIVAVFIINAISTDAQWVRTDATIKSVSAIAVKDSVLFAATQEGVYMSTNSGDAWARIAAQVDGVSITLSDTSVFVGTYMYIYRANIDGTDWRKCFYLWADIYALMAVPNATGGWWIYAGTPYSSKFAPDGGVLLSRNNGVSWVPSKAGITFPFITAFARIGSYTFAGTKYAGVQNQGGVYVSANDGATWQEFNAGLANRSIGALGATGTSIFAGTEYGIFRYTLGGEQWTEVNAGLTNPFVTSFAVGRTPVFAATQDGVFRPTDNGGSWTNISASLPTTHVKALAVSEGFLFAGTNGGGLWRRPLAEVTDVASGDDRAPGAFELRQKYPNPFNPSTTFSFSLPSRSFVSLKIFDVMGREVATVVSEELPAGTFSRQWNAAAHPSGMCFYMMHAGAYTERNAYYCCADPGEACTTGHSKSCRDRMFVSKKYM